MKNIKGFTLAEVLITLAIIGVVAALTIPTVVTKYQKVQYYTQFMKVYNTLSEALSLSQAGNGNFDTWGIKYNMNRAEATNIVNNYFIPYLKVSKTCDLNNDNCGLGDLNISPLSGDAKAPYIDTIEGLNVNGVDPLMLTDGTIISFNEFDADSETNHAEIFIDTNGIKGPNTMGRDIFLLKIRKVDEKYKLTADGLYGDHEVGPATTAVTSNSYEEAMYEFNDGGSSVDPVENEPLCSTDKECFGFGCAGRLLLQHKMDY